MDAGTGSNCCSGDVAERLRPS